MKNLFDKTCRYTQDAMKVDTQTHTVLKPIFDHWIKKGYSPREIAHLMSLTITDIEMDAVLIAYKKKPEI